MPKIANSKTFGPPIFQEDLNIVRLQPYDIFLVKEGVISLYNVMGIILLKVKKKQLYT